MIIKSNRSFLDDFNISLFGSAGNSCLQRLLVILVGFFSFLSDYHQFLCNTIIWILLKIKTTFKPSFILDKSTSWRSTSEKVIGALTRARGRKYQHD
jgi:hypothetical protein